MASMLDIIQDDNNRVLEQINIKKMMFFHDCLDLLKEQKEKIIKLFIDYIHRTKDHEKLYEYINNNLKNKNFWSEIKLDLIKSYKDDYKLIAQRQISLLCTSKKNTQDILYFLNQVLTKNNTSLSVLTNHITMNLSNIIIRSLDQKTDYKSIASYIFSNFGQIFVKKIHKNLDDHLTKYKNHPDKNIYIYEQYEDSLSSVHYFLVELYFYLEKQDKTNQQSINWKYIASNKCNFNWFKKRYTDKYDYSLRDKLFFSILYSSHITYATIVKKLLVYPKYIASLENYRDKKNQLYDFIIKREDIDKKILITREYLIKYESLISQVNIRMVDFYNTFSKYLTQEIYSKRVVDIHFDEIIDDFMLFLKYNYKNSPGPSLESYKILFLSSDPDNLNMNYYTIGSVFTVIERVFEKHNLRDSYVICSKNMIKQVIKLSNMSSSSNYINLETKHETYHSMCKLINNNTGIKDIFNDTFKDYYSSIKFINSLLKDINLIVSHIRTCIINRNDGVEESLDASKTHYKILWNLCTMNNTSKILLDPVILDEMLRTINYTVKTISQFLLNYKFSCDPHDLIKYIHIVFETIIGINSSKKVDMKNALEYSKDSYTQTMEFYIKKEINYDLVKILEILTNHSTKKTIDQDQDIPDKFLDPLTYMLITDPVVLPGNSQEAIYIDRSTIVKCLLEKEEDPFTRNGLTIKELDDYNNTDEAVELINIFKQDYLDYKNSKKK